MIIKNENRIGGEIHEPKNVTPGLTGVLKLNGYLNHGKRNHAICSTIHHMVPGILSTDSFDEFSGLIFS